MTRLLQAALLLAAAAAAADVPDLTADMEPLCNPNATRWTASQPMARATTSIGVCDGRLFVSGGDWDANLGPCPIFAVDPYTGAYAKEFDSGTESIDYFRTDSEGCLYAPSVDPREGHANECNVARRNADGTWTPLKIAPNRWISDAYYGTHTWDVAFWKGRIFTAGYGIGAGPEKTTARLSDATPQVKGLYRVYASQFGGTFQRYRRFYAFLPFEDDLFCYPLVYSGVGNNAYSKIGSYDYEEWRYDEATGTFACTTKAFKNVTPGLSRSDLAFVSDSSMDVQLWHPTAFKGRVLYIAGIPEMTTVPFALYTATNADHSVRATRVNLGSGVFPFDIFVHDDVMTVLAAQYDGTSKKAVNSVWESADGVTFEKKFTFSGVQYANAIAYCDGAYFVAMGAREAVKNAWTFAGTDEVGMLYRIRDPAFADAIQVVAESEAVSIAEGGTAVARFRLAARPAAAVTAAVRVSGGVPAVSADVASVTFTPADWDAWHEVPLSVAEDDLDTSTDAVLLCGFGAPAALRAASVVVTPVNNDVFVPLTTADSGAVATNSAAHAQYGANGAFDDNRSDTNGRWLAVKADHMFVVYEFDEATAVDTLRVWNGSDSAGGYASASRAPKAWTFSGSNDGETWTTLDTRSNETGWSASGESRMYSFDNDTAYLYYKFDCTALNGASDYLQIWELEFYCLGDGGGSGGGGTTGEVLVYEGFHAADYTTTSETSLNGKKPTGNNIGFEASSSWGGGTAIPKTTAGSLALGAAFDASETNGTGRLVMKYNGTAAAGRGLYRKFSAALPTSGTVYYRFLMRLNETSDKYLATLQSGGYWAGGLVKSAFNGAQDAMKSLTTDGLWMGYKKVGSTISLFARIGETDYLLPFNTADSSPLLDTTSTYVFVAKIEIGAGAGGTDRVSVAAQPIAAGVFSREWVWAVADVEANVVSGGTPVSYVAFAGQYQTGGCEVAIDQFKIATSLDLVCDRAAAAVVLPDALVLGAPDGEPPLSFVENGAGEDCFRVVLAEAVPGPYYTPFAAASLAERARAAADSTTVSVAGPLAFDVPTENRSSLFVSIVASTGPFLQGDLLPAP